MSTFVEEDKNMDKQKVDMYLVSNQKYFPAEKMALIKEKTDDY